MDKNYLPVRMRPTFSHSLDPKPKFTTDRYQVLQSNDGTIRIPRGVNFPKIPNTPLVKIPI